MPCSPDRQTASTAVQLGILAVRPALKPSLFHNLLDFLADCQIDHDPINLPSAVEAARIMREYARNKGPRERVAPDFLIGAHASQQADALLTTDAGFFRHYFQKLNVVTP